MWKNVQILKLFQWFQPITNDYTRQPSLMMLCNMTTMNMANNSFKFSDDQIDVLTNLCQSEPALWNSNLLIYSNADAREAALACISCQLNIDTGRPMQAVMVDVAYRYDDETFNKRKKCSASCLTKQVCTLYCIYINYSSSVTYCAFCTTKQVQKCPTVTRAHYKHGDTHPVQTTQVPDACAGKMDQPISHSCVS